MAIINIAATRCSPSRLRANILAATCFCNEQYYTHGVSFDGRNSDGNNGNGKTEKWIVDFYIEISHARRMQ